MSGTLVEEPTKGGHGGQGKGKDKGRKPNKSGGSCFNPSGLFGEIARGYSDADVVTQQLANCSL